MSELILRQGGNVFTLGDSIMRAGRPDTLPNIPATTAHYRADSCVVDGSNFVSQWNDLSGNGYHALQALQTNKPLKVAGALNGKPVLRFDGSNDRLVASFGRDYNQPNTFFLVWKATNTDTAARIAFTGISGSKENRIYSQINVIRLGTESSEISYGKTTPFSNFIISTGLVNLGSSKFYENGVLQNTASAISHNHPLSGITIGSWRTENLFFLGDIAELIFYNSELSTAQQKNVEAYLSQRYNIALP